MEDYLSEGRIVQIISKKKALVQVHLKGRFQKAVIQYNKFRIRRNGKPLPKNGSFEDFTTKDSSVKVLFGQPSYPITRSFKERRNWTVLRAWVEAPGEESDSEEETFATEQRKRTKKLEDLMENIKRICECMICFENLKGPLPTCENGHVICKDCIPYLKEGRCPVCNALYVANITPLFLRNLLDVVGNID